MKVLMSIVFLSACGLAHAAERHDISTRSYLDLSKDFSWLFKLDEDTASLGTSSSFARTRSESSDKIMLRVKSQSSIDLGEYVNERRMLAVARRVMRTTSETLHQSLSADSIHN